MSHLPHSFLALLQSAGDGTADPLFIFGIIIIVLVLIAMYVYFRRKRKK
ncbi:MAG: LPXTG cell wall anchor domain-containing protein [Holophagales bacterium]|jgi:LPXTG-motif cell wall-anchored protein|nr:LPXTG cell wall anchor domain-containing protein [Holophagales bacterium]